MITPGSGSLLSDDGIGVFTQITYLWSQPVMLTGTGDTNLLAAGGAELLQFIMPAGGFVSGFAVHATGTGAGWTAGTVAGRVEREPVGGGGFATLLTSAALSFPAAATVTAVADSQVIGLVAIPLQAGDRLRAIAATVGLVTQLGTILSLTVRFPVLAA